jgi:tetratricopeptide (TPR) repeat protein
MPRELIHLNLRTPLTRVIAILFLIAAACWSYFALSWYIGNTLAENFSGAENDLEVAKFGASMAPSDPLTHWRLALVSQTRLPVDQISQAIAEYEKAVSLSPYDYRFWTALGTAYEQAGDAARSEVALKKAVFLAPSYAQPHWYLGNLFLRNGRYDEAFDELRKAAEANHELRPQLFSHLWQIYESDFDSLRKAVGERADTRAAFSLHLVTQRKYEEGLRMWNSLSLAEKRENRSEGESVISNLIANSRFYDALAVFNELAPSESSRGEVGRMVDGSFEEITTYGPEMVFGWQVKNVPQMQIGIDPSTAHTGKRSLRLSFQVRSRLESLNASQLVPVSPDTNYEFEFYLKTAELESGATPAIVIINPLDGGALASSEGAPNGDNDWQRVALSFKTPPKVEAVTVRIVRGTCGDTPLCPIFGSLWYDDFSFKRRD